MALPGCHNVALVSWCYRHVKELMAMTLKTLLTKCFVEYESYLHRVRALTLKASDKRYVQPSRSYHRLFTTTSAPGPFTNGPFNNTPAWPKHTLFH